MSIEPRPPRGDDPGWAMTLAFWGVLLVAGALFAAVALAPRFATVAALRADYAANQLRLVALERRAIDLERVAEALEHDPRFAAELAKLDLAADRPGDERIAVPPDLRLGAEERSAAPTAAPPEHWSLPPTILVPLANHAGLRTSLVALAAALTLFAFLVLHDEQAETVRAMTRATAGAAHRFGGRYRSGGKALAKTQRPRRENAA